MLCALINILKQGFAGLDWIIATLLLYILSFLPSKFTQPFYPFLFRRWCWVFVRALGVHLHLHQKNKFPLPSHYLIIANHPSIFEDIGMPALFPAHYLAKAELKSWYILGRISVAAGTLYVQRESKESRRATSEYLVKALAEGKNIGLYPEGGCKGRRISLPFQYGGLNAALQTQTPIIPVFLHYEAQEAFEWRSDESVVKKLWHIIKSPNKNVHYYVFDALDPTLFKTKEELGHHIESLYLQWQSQYLE